MRIRETGKIGSTVFPVSCLGLVTAAAEDSQQHQKEVDKIQI